MDKSNKQILLVEGEQDRKFFEAVFRKFLEEVVNVPVLKDVTIYPPRESGAENDGIANAIKSLRIQLNFLKTGRIERLGVIVDADHFDITHPGNCSGFIARREQVIGIFKGAGYDISPSLTPTPCTGEIFHHPNGRPSVGLWIMPDHSSDGMIENFVQTLITDPLYSSLMDAAISAIEALPESLRLFNKKIAKARVLTWLAWQKNPGNSLHRAIQHSILNINAESGKALKCWLEKVFY